MKLILVSCEQPLSLHRSIRLWETKSLGFVLASLAFALQEALFPPHSRVQDFLVQLTNTHAYADQFSFIHSDYK